MQIQTPTTRRGTEFSQVGNNGHLGLVNPASVEESCPPVGYYESVTPTQFLDNKMSIIPEYLNKYLDHPNRVESLDELQPGDWIIPVFNGRLSKASYEQVHMDQTIRISSKVTHHSEYDHSFFINGICKSESVVPRTYGQYHWFGNYHIILKLPDSQQKAYEALYQAIEAGNEAHKLAWTDWARKNR